VSILGLVSRNRQRSMGRRGRRMRKGKQFEEVKEHTTQLEERAPESSNMREAGGKTREAVMNILGRPCEL
jgi:hypothetical protein